MENDRRPVGLRQTEGDVDRRNMSNRKKSEGLKVHPEAETEFGRRINLGNLESNLLSLRTTGLLRPEDMILEVGSGYGSMLHHLFDGGFQVQGVEKSSARIETSRKLYGDLPYIVLPEQGGAVSGRGRYGAVEVDQPGPPASATSAGVLRGGQEEVITGTLVAVCIRKDA